MTWCKKMPRTICLLLLVFPSVLGYPYGPPGSTCGSMFPGHGFLDQSGPGPYSISLDKNTYSENSQIQGTLNGTDSFTGFFIQPRNSTDDATTYGTISGPANSRNPCTSGTAAIGHTDKNVKTSITFTWTAPDSDVGPLIFVFTVVKDGRTYWVRRASEPVTYQSSAQSTQVPMTPTQTPTEAPTTTTAAQPNDRPTTIDRDPACGVTKGCFPADCTTDCDYFIAWENTGQEDVTFTMYKRTTSSNYYMAIGLSQDPVMQNDSVSQCVSRDGLVIVQSSFNIISNYKSNSLLDNPVFGVELIDGFYANGILGCTFIRKKNAVYANNAVRGRKKRATADGSTFFDLATEWHLFFAHGNALDGLIRIHSTLPVISQQKINFLTVETPTTTTPSPTVAGVIRKDSSCGIEMGCYYKCENDECRFLFMWDKDGVEEKEFTFSSKQTGSRYAAVALSSDDNMGSDYVIAMVPTNDGAEVRNFYNDGQRAVPLSDSFLGLRIISQSNVDGIMMVKFVRTMTYALTQSNTGRRKRAAAGPNTFFDMNRDWTLFYAEGPYIGEYIGKHTSRPLISNEKADFQSAMDIGGEEEDMKLVYLHATFMVTAWMFFASFGIFTARYFKGTWPEGTELCGEKRWFAIHRACMILVFLFTAAGFVVIFVHVEGYSDIDGSNYEKSHPIIGIVVMALAVLNPLLALIRPHPGTKYRPLFNVFHWIFGQSAYSLSIVNIFSGTVLSLTNVPSYIRIILYVFVGWIVVIEVSFTVLVHCRKKERSEAYEMTSKGVYGNTQDARQGSEQCRTMFLVFHVIALLGFAAATAVIIWVERDDE